MDWLRLPDQLAGGETMTIDRYSYFPVLDYLPLSDTERKILAMVLTFANKNGLCLSNLKIGQSMNRSEHTVKKAITNLRQKGLIITDKTQSKHRVIWPGNPESYLTALNGQVEGVFLDSYLTIFKSYLTAQSGHLLDHPERSTQGNKEIKRKPDFSLPDAGAKTPPDPSENNPPTAYNIDDLPDPDYEAVLSKLGATPDKIAELKKQELI